MLVYRNKKGKESKCGFSLQNDAGRDPHLNSGVWALRWHTGFLSDQSVNDIRAYKGNVGLWEKWERYECSDAGDDVYAFRSMKTDGDYYLSAQEGCVALKQLKRNEISNGRPVPKMWAERFRLIPHPFEYSQYFLQCIDGSGRKGRYLLALS